MNPPLTTQELELIAQAITFYQNQDECWPDERPLLESILHRIKDKDGFIRPILPPYPLTSVEAFGNLLASHGVIHIDAIEDGEDYDGLHTFCKCALACNDLRSRLGFPPLS